MNLARMIAKWDRIAYAQLTEAAARLAAENDELRDALCYAQDAAESWRDDCLRMIEDSGERATLSQDGRVGVSR